jgi:hypothetical protein
LKSPVIVKSFLIVIILTCFSLTAQSIEEFDSSIRRTSRNISDSIAESVYGFDVSLHVKQAKDLRYEPALEEKIATDDFFKELKKNTELSSEATDTSRILSLKIGDFHDITTELVLDENKIVRKIYFDFLIPGTQPATRASVYWEIPKELYEPLTEHLHKDKVDWGFDLLLTRYYREILMGVAGVNHSLMKWVADPKADQKAKAEIAKHFPLEEHIKIELETHGRAYYASSMERIAEREGYIQLAYDRAYRERNEALKWFIETQFEKSYEALRKLVPTYPLASEKIHRQVMESLNHSEAVTYNRPGLFFRQIEASVHFGMRTAKAKLKSCSYVF